MKFRLHKSLPVLIWFLSLMMLVSACGRTIPAIQPELLHSKKSVLLLTGASLSEPQSQEIANAALESARKQPFALETVTRTASITPELLTEIKTKPFDAVIAAGDELFSDLLTLSQEQTDKRFLLLQSGPVAAPVPAAIPANVSMKQIDGKAAFAQWDEWVKLQRASGMNLLWVTRTTSPVPSEWAPSEEADAVLQLDVYPEDQWLTQLTYQARQIQAPWIVFYSEVDAKTANKIKTLRIPIMDMNGGTSVSYHWSSIMTQEIAGLLAENWKGGAGSSYTPEQVTVTRK